MRTRDRAVLKMVKIKPFKGIRYDKKKITDFSLIICPPYDVISKEELDKLQKKSQFNFSWIILNKDMVGDDGENRYTRAAALFREWLKKEILEQDKEDSIYVYTQTYKINGSEKIRLGFISLLELEIGKGIFDHERTMTKPIEDRLSLMKQTFANLEQVFCLYDDREKIIENLLKNEINGKEPLMDFLLDKVQHKLWKISDKNIIDKVINEMEQYSVIIADGHHRTKTRRIFKEMHPELEGAKYSMITFVNSFDTGLVILPTNRLVFGLNHIDKNKFIEEFKKYFFVEKVRDENEMINILEKTEIMIDKTKNLKSHVIGMHINSDKSSYILKLINRDILNDDYPDKSDIFRKLDVNILHKLIIEKILNISEKDQEEIKVEFVKGNEETLNKLKTNKKYQIGFFLNPPLIREVFLTARANEFMPQKSTFFYPKIYSGLVCYKLKQEVENGK